jgi:L-aminopeptidase/D-esterase-like protein
MSDAPDPTGIIVGLRADFSEMNAALRDLQAQVEKLAKRPDPAAGIPRAVEAAVRASLGQVADELRQRVQEANRSASAIYDARRAAERERRDWRPWLYGSAGAGAGAMLVLVVLVLRLLPGGVGDRLYAAATGQDRVTAAANMLRLADREFYNRIVDANALLQRAGPEIDKCLKAAEKATKPHKCSITFAPPQVAQKN